MELKSSSQMQIRTQAIKARMLTFQALGAIRRASSTQNIACELIPWLWYRSASSHQASASVGKASTNSTRAEMASEILDIDRRSAIRRFRIGYQSHSQSGHCEHSITRGTDHIRRLLLEDLVVLMEHPFKGFPILCNSLLIQASETHNPLIGRAKASGQPVKENMSGFIVSCPETGKEMLFVRYPISHILRLKE